MPGEGGIYLWAKRIFGDFHGFSVGAGAIGPTTFFYPAHCAAVLRGHFRCSWLAPEPSNLADNVAFTLTSALILLAVLTTPQRFWGSAWGKWVNNLGGIGTAIAAVVLIGLGIAAWHHAGRTVLGG